MWCRFSTLTLIVVVLSVVTSARDKVPYRSTKLIELNSRAGGFCFVIQLDDLAYTAVAEGHTERNLVVGDPIQVKVSGDYIWLKVEKKYPLGSDYYSDEVKSRITVRKRMTQDSQLPTCALPVAIH
jgi:hypothetical protein